MAKKFQKLPRLVQIILLLIPGVNWITELVVRVCALFEKPDGRNVLGFIIAIPLGIPLGWLDLVWCLVFKHLFLCKA